MSDCIHLKGILTPVGKLSGTLSARSSLKGVLNRVSGFQYYPGPYEVDPEFDSVVLETNNKLMTDDVTVNPIYVGRTSNPSGGITVYIGGTI